MLNIDPAKRFTIDQVMSNRWIAPFHRLHCTQIKCLRKVSKCGLEVQEEMTRSLATMRVDYDQVQIKTLENSNNPLLNKRRKKSSTPIKQ
ncbi:hypothetical protein NQ318_012873 [Aromia moschata]|uniref:non-specific serine/threonine protein kinase n=1 Tax=Aromia moschata TaxID=1265417 RepID=A0AAV8YDR7_9CUCU|nr:hypothetical protein NQ318_012873 [Aromia moschata]